jgi:hypothetical protein
VRTVDVHCPETACVNTVKKGDVKNQLNEVALGGPPDREESYVEKGIMAFSLEGYRRPASGPG